MELGENDPTFVIRSYRPGIKVWHLKILPDCQIIAPF